MEVSRKERHVSMGEIIEQIEQNIAFAGKGDTRKRYPGKCPVCGKENWICKSIAMEMGINTGHGSCLGCHTFMHIKFNPERQEMDLERFEDYKNSQQSRKDMDAMAGNTGYGGQDDDEQK
jgi:transcription elongation factor Elf1